ncbi:MAG: SAM-dependent chlorinase/fluorinase [Candidatus Sumerlaeia bacterium]|nr:SAM-dependent chlorinase/fluorinase [Candidatus Sumerlaeia bacterium]
MIPRPLFFLTDFGLSDPYVGIMKAVALQHHPGAPLVDITHAVEPGSILHGALLLEAALPWLPRNATLCAVVDPGVGTHRTSLVVQAGEQTFVGPNNGVLSAAFDLPGARNFSLQSPSKTLPSNTFHGRDLYAPAAALLARDGLGARWPWGESGAVCGGEVQNPVRVSAPNPRPLSGGWAVEILFFDRFGNGFLNLRQIDAALGSTATLRRGAEVLARGVRQTYGEVTPGEALLYWGSSGWLEVGVNQGSARERLGLRLGEVLEVTGD